MAPSKTKAAKTSNTTTANATNPSLSEFADSKIAVGAALTYIEELQKSLPLQKYEQILALLNNYYNFHLTEQVVYLDFKAIVKGERGEAALVKGFERFLPEGALVGVEEGEEKDRKARDEISEVGDGNNVSGKSRSEERITDVTDEEKVVEGGK